MIAFLAGDDAGYVIGHSIHVNNGRHRNRRVEENHVHACGRDRITTPDP
ncbi:hypothetical protein [Actinomadura sp. 6N118]